MTVVGGGAWATGHELCIGNRELPTATHPFTSSSNVRMSLMAWSTSSFFVPS